MGEKYQRIYAKDKRLRPMELADVLKNYILQFVSPSDMSEKLIKMVGDDSYEFVLHCMWNLKQK